MNLARYLANIFLFALLMLIACRPNSSAPKLASTELAKSGQRSGGWIALGVDFEGDFSFGPEGNAEIVLLGVESAQKDHANARLINLTNHPANDLTPTWSPDGDRLAFRSSRDGNDEIYVINADGSGLTN